MTIEDEIDRLEAGHWPKETKDALKGLGYSDNDIDIYFQGIVAGMRKMEAARQRLEGRIRSFEKIVCGLSKNNNNQKMQLEQKERAIMDYKENLMVKPDSLRKKLAEKDKEIERLQKELQSNSRDFWKAEAIKLKGEIERLQTENVSVYRCPDCGKIRRHDKEVHTFVCECGNREWYPERESDKKHNTLTAEDIKSIRFVAEHPEYGKSTQFGIFWDEIRFDNPKDGGMPVTFYPTDIQFQHEKRRMKLTPIEALAKTKKEEIDMKVCKECNKEIKKEDLTVYWEYEEDWEYEEEGKSGEVHIDCIFKKDLVICSTNDCGWFGDRNDMTDECSECGGKTRKLTNKDKAKIRNDASKLKEALAKKEGMET